MKLKGKATFELTNVETGEKRVIQEENMITNAFQYFVNCGGALGASSYDKCKSRDNTSFYNMMSNGNNGYDSIYSREALRRYTNGLLLFSGPLNEDPDHVYVNADDPDLVGAGAEVAYSGNNVAAGSYNAVESGPIENGYKHVWDFSTSQGNGDIGCACLTTIMGASLGGGVGFDNSADWRGTFPSEYVGYSYTYIPPIDDYFQSTQSWLYTGYLDAGRELFIRTKNYYSFPLSYSTSTGYVANEEDINGNVVSKRTFDKTFLYKKSIDLDIYRFPFNSISIFDETYYTTKNRKYQDKNTVTTYEGNLKYLETVTVDMPTALANLIPSDLVTNSVNTNNPYYWITQYHFDEGFMYISFIIPETYNKVPVLKSGDKIYVWKINMNTFESTWFSITNTTGQSINMSSNSAHSTNKQWIITNDYTVLFSVPGSMEGNMWIIDNATGSTIKQVVYSDDTVFYKSNIQAAHFVRNNMLYFFEINRDSVFGTMLCINLKTGIVKHSGSSNQYRFYVYGTRTYGTKFPLIVYCGYNSYSSYSCYPQFYVDPNMLMTINNLEDVVTKTSAETMKVTYILTQEEAEE